MIYTPAMCMAIFVIGIGGLITIWRGGVGHLKFTPAMVEIADARKTRVVEWDDIVDIKDHSETKEGKSPAGRWCCASATGARRSSVV